MTDALTTPLAIPGSIPLTLFGEPAAAACESDSCAIPGGREQAVVNHRLHGDLG